MLKIESKRTTKVYGNEQFFTIWNILLAIKRWKKNFSLNFLILNLFILKQLKIEKLKTLIYETFFLFIFF